MAVGIPVIVPDSGGIREAVEAGTTGLKYQALDIKGLAAAMLRLNRNPQESQAMGAAARRVAEERFSVRTYVQRLYSTYGVDSPSSIRSALS
jgi:glycosyltransferase involved in cell wall biosynthesis